MVEPDRPQAERLVDLRHIGEPDRAALGDAGALKHLTRKHDLDRDVGDSGPSIRGRDPTGVT